jgi:hypothetical protein
LRIVVAGLMPIAPGFREGARVAIEDPARWFAPEGLGWFVRYVPIGGVLATTAQVVIAFAALCAIAGMRARLCFAVLAVAGYYLYAIAQLAGHVWHDMHLLWFCALLAASPCADVLAVEARHPLATAGSAYALPLLVVRLLLAAIYFFPGLHKLGTSGLAWALSDNLRHQLYWKWAEHGALPGWRVDRHPWILHAGGLFVLAFELSFVVLVLFRRTRAAAALAGLLFHLLSQLIFSIPFASLWLCYVALIDPRRVLRLLSTSAHGEGDGPHEGISFHAPAPRRAQPGLAAVGALLLLGAVVQGARGQTESYPFACYPTFEWIAGSDMPDLLIAVVDDGRRPFEVPHSRSGSGYRSQRQWGEIWSLAGVTAPVDPRRLRAYYAGLGRPRSPSPGSRRVLFFRVYRSVVPGDHGRLTRPPLKLLVLSE